MNDQATTLRRLMADPPELEVELEVSRLEPAEIRAPRRLGRAIAVCSGKGGVGKSNITVGLAVELARRGLAVGLLDADLGMANVDVLCGIVPERTLEDVASGHCRLDEVVVTGPGGFHLIPGASGAANLADLEDLERARMLGQLADFEADLDVLLIDTGAGIGANVLGFAAAAGTALIVTTPEPTAITDAYGAIKALTLSEAASDLRVIVNMASSAEEADSAFNRLHTAASRCLDVELTMLGAVPLEASVRDAVRQRLPFALAHPQSRSARAVHDVTDRLLGLDPPRRLEGRDGFFRRLSSWFGGR